MDTTNHEALIDALGLAGVYQYAGPGALHRAREQAQQTGTVLMTGWGRDYPTDDEDLAEGGVGELIETVRPFLEAQGVQINTIEDDCQGEDYTVRVDGRPFVMYTAEELSRNSPDIWSLASYRTCALLSTLLREAGSEERAYSLGGGNDAILLFLTPAQFDLLQQAPALPARAKPEPPQYLL